MFFHVLIKVNGKDEILFKDLPKRELLKVFVKPFRKNKKFYLDGKYYSISELEYTKIFKTDSLIEEETRQANKENMKFTREINASQSGAFVFPSFYGEKRTIKVSSEVTQNFLTKAPNEGNIVIRILYNPWVVGVGVGTVLLFLGYLLSAKH